MSHDPFVWPKQGAPSSSLGSSTWTQGFSKSAGLSSQQQAPAPSGGWVAFDDDAGGRTAFTTAPAPLPQPQSPPADAGASPWPVAFPGTEDEWPSAPVFNFGANHTDAGSNAFPSAPFKMGTGMSTPAPSSAPTSASRTATGLNPAPQPTRDQPLVTSVSSVVAAAAPPAFSQPTPQPGAPAATGSETEPSSLGAAAPGRTSFTALPAGQIHRLLRPPTSASRTATPAAAASGNPFATATLVPMTAASTNNPFLIPTGAKPPGAAPAAPVSRTLDPFADLSLKPQLPRPPPMAAARGIIPTAAAAATPGAGPAPATATVQPLTMADLVGTGMGQSAQAGSPSPAGASGSHAAGPPAAAVPGAAGSGSPFPTFAALHRSPPAAGPGSAGAGAETATGAPRSAAAAAVSPLAAEGAARAALQTPRPPPAVEPKAAVAGELLRPSSEPGVIETTTFDAFDALAKAARRAERQAAKVAAAIAAAQSPPPPPYSVAIDLPPAPPQRDVLLLYGEPAAISQPFGAPAAVAARPPSDAAAAAAPPPPPYFEALDMPPAEPPSALPPPSCTEALDLPLAGLGAPTAADTDAATWAAFDSFLSGTGTGSGPSGPTTGAMTVSVRAPGASPMRGSAPNPCSALPSQICVEVRLPPLKPKEASCPRRLVAGMGMAFAAPGGDGVAALQWTLRLVAYQHLHPHPHHPGDAQGHAASDGAPRPCFELPSGGSCLPSSEDWDSAPAAAVMLQDLAATCCLLLDDVSSSLWTGHKDGRVVRWKVEPGRPAAFQHQWKPHIRGRVTHMALDPWGDLWTASSAGSIRVWQYPATGPAMQPPVRLFECRRSRLTLGSASRATAQRAHSKARLLALGPSGRVMWSAGRTALVLWGAYDGEFLGTMSPGVVQDGSRTASGIGAGVYAGDTGAGFRVAGPGEAGPQQLVINSQTGLETSLVNRPISPRVVDGGDEAEAADQELELGQVFKDLAGGAFKLASKLGKKIRQNLYDNNTASNGDAPGPNETGAAPGGGGGRGKVVALVPGVDASMYVAYREGVLEKYTEWGRLLWTKDHGRGATFHSALLVGSLLWLGCGDGFIRTVAASTSTGELGRSWKAHDFAVVALAHDAGVRDRGSGLVYSLAEIGSIRAWPAVPPEEPQLLAWRDGLLPLLEEHQLKVLAATWNVNETRPSPQSLRDWLAPGAKAEIAAIALQEVEMGTSSVARDAAITLLSKGMLERGNQNAQWWAVELGAALEAASGDAWNRVALRQMSGLVVLVFCRKQLMRHVGEVATAKVACGVMGVGGNKGAVAVSMSVFRRRLMFVSSHFAAHHDRVEERNDNYNKIVRQLHFHNTSRASRQQGQQQRQQQPRQCVDVMVTRESGFDGAVEAGTDADIIQQSASNRSLNDLDDDGHGPGMSDAAMLVWAGDFNYRINLSYSEVCKLACTGAFEELFRWDQCRIEMERGNIFRGLHEPLLPRTPYPLFAPTYKYDKGVPPEVVTSAEGRSIIRLPYDSSEKQRVPGWTDRVFYRGSRPGGHDVMKEEVKVSIERATDYNCVMHVNDSDHKPVYALLQVDLPSYKQEEKRGHSLACALALHQAALAPGPAAARQHPQPQPLVRLSVESVEVRPKGDASVCLLNNSPFGFNVQVVAERLVDGVPGGGGGGGFGTVLCPLPSWLEVTPMSFILQPGAGAGAGANPSSQDSGLVLLRTPPCDDVRVVESVQLRFRLHPLWGSDTVLGAVGPVLRVMRRQLDGGGL